jgi:hypothetical protein
MTTRSRVRTLKHAMAQVAVVVAVLTVTAWTVIGGQQPTFFQERFKTGQTVAPAYEGWEQNPDGSINLLFGYFNRNWEEQTHVPIGPANSIEPGGPDQGQPTRFFPRRNKFIFTIRVPKDFGTKEIVWTLTTQGKTERAYATLKPDYKIDKRVYMTNMHMRLNMTDYPEFDQDMIDDVAPVVRLEGAPQRTVKVGEPLSLDAFVSDDGKMKAKPAVKGVNDSDTTALGLRVAWYVYRGGGRVTFEPEQFKVWQDKTPGGNSPWTPAWMPPPLPADGRHPVKVTFHQPGNYTIRLLAHDGALQTHADVVVNVTGGPSTSASRQ